MRECGLRCRDSVVSVVKRELNLHWRGLLINYLAVLIIIRNCLHMPNSSGDIFN